MAIRAAAGIFDQSEPDFFDWVLEDIDGQELVTRVASQARRFALSDIKNDILKALYESLIDPETRHDLGEYYTPDWLAERMVDVAIEQPLQQRVIDPACGSGTFLFHVVRKIISTALSAGKDPEDAIGMAVSLVYGIDIHPVAVIFARASYLLALLPATKSPNHLNISIPVYLGDALQWNIDSNNPHNTLLSVSLGVRAVDEVISVQIPESVVTVPKLRKLSAKSLRFPSRLAERPREFDAMISSMIDCCDKHSNTEVFEAWLRGNVGSLSEDDVQTLIATCGVMIQLSKEGRNHIWGYVIRNLVRPVWLSSDDQKADVVMGNPPWVSFRYMGQVFQGEFIKHSKDSDVWVGGNQATHNDLAAYFFMRVAYLYMKRDGGRIAFVMPHAAMSRPAYKHFRRGRLRHAGSTISRLRITEAWGFGANVQPLFPVPSCVFFAQPNPDESSFCPATYTEFAGELPTRNATGEQASNYLTSQTSDWPVDTSDLFTASEYRDRFHQGATLVPRRLVLIERINPSRLDTRPQNPLVRGRVGSMDKSPWKNMQPPECLVEGMFLRPVLSGESVAPHVLLRTMDAVIPYDEERNELMDSRRALASGRLRIAKWLMKCEEIWDSGKKSPIAFLERIDYYRKLSAQFPIPSIRVVYSASGTYIAACVVEDRRAVIDSSLYWAGVSSLTEARYICVILNSRELGQRVSPLQSQGQWGARHIHKYPFSFPIPLFDSDNNLHSELANLEKVAENIAESVEVKDDAHFISHRKRIRNAIQSSKEGIRIELLVSRLLSDDHT